MPYADQYLPISESDGCAAIRTLRVLEERPLRSVAMTTLHLRPIGLLTRWRPDCMISKHSMYKLDCAYLVLPRMEAECPVAGEEACSRLPSAGNGLGVERQWEEHCTAALGKDRYCTAGIAGEEEEHSHSYSHVSVVGTALNNDALNHEVA